MRENWRTRGSSWQKFVRSSISPIAMEKTIRGSFIRTRMGENSELRMYVRSVNKACFCQYMWMTWGLLERSRIWLQCERDWWKNVDIDEPTSFLDHVYLGCTQRACEPNEAIIEQYTKMIESRISAGATEQLPGWQKPHAQTVAWSYNMEAHAQKSVERYCEWHTRKWSNFRPLVQSGRTWISPRIVRSFITNCFVMLVLGTNWTTWHLVVREQSVKISHKLDSRTW